MECSGRIYPNGIRRGDNSLVGNVSELRLEECGVSAIGLNNILTTWKNLETLYVHWCKPMRNSPQIDWSALGVILRRAGGRLQRLSLYADDRESRENDLGIIWSVKQGLGDLRPLVSLKCLDVDELGLLGKAHPSSSMTYPNFEGAQLVHTLPRSLESLKITKCKGGGQDPMRNLESQVLSLLDSNSFGKLHTIELTPHSPLAADVSKFGWHDSESGPSRVMLRRLRPRDDGETEELVTAANVAPAS